MKAIYIEVIDLLMNGDIDFRLIALNLAKEQPDVFVRLASKKMPEPWAVNAFRSLRSNQKVDGIKIIRAATGLGLKEAKDVADNVCWEMGKRNDFEWPQLAPMPCELHEDTRKVFRQVMMAA